MKKWFFLAILFGGLYYYATHTETGKTQFRQLADRFSQWLPYNAGNSSTHDGKTSVYKVQNPDGSWTFTNEKPQDQTNAVEQQYRSDTNVLPSVSGDDAAGKK